jgi:hypothetical protein
MPAFNHIIGLATFRRERTHALSTLLSSMRRRDDALELRFPIPTSPSLVIVGHNRRHVQAQ